jgi:nucleotide-binding universal stress UspA family protein
MFKHILLPTDGSERSLRAARLGIALARQMGASVHAYHVLAPLAAIAYVSDLIRQAPDDYRHDAIDRAQQQLGVIHELANEACVPFGGDYAFDHRPYTAIVAAARKYGCDLIVMGTHGRTGLDRLVLGSETCKVLDCVEIPVLVCH